MRVHLIKFAFYPYRVHFSLTIQLLFPSPVARIPSAASQTRGAIAAVIAAIASSCRIPIVVASYGCVMLLRALTVARLHAPSVALTVASSLDVVLSIKTALRLSLFEMIVPLWLYAGLTSRLETGFIC